MLLHRAESEPGIEQAKLLRANFRRIERREWWLWAVAILITLLLTIGLASFLLPDADLHQDSYSLNGLPLVVRGLMGLVLLFDLYTIYQHLLIHRIRRELVEREELFHLISENAADMIAIVDMEGRRIFNSLSYQKVMGYSPEEWHASSAFEQIHPDDRERVKEAAREARHSGIGQTLEYRLRHKNGTWLVLESTSSVIRNTNGDPEKLVIVNRNITERKRAEEALRRSEADFRSVVEDAPYGIYRASVTGRFLQVNPAVRKMLGYEQERELLERDLATDIFQHNGEYQRLTVPIGFDVVKDIPFLANAAELLLMHHEQYGGGGYPRGIKGEEILLGARIFAVADTLDAITSDRPYRRASSFQSARETIRQCSGTQFDPKVVDVFLSSPEEIWPTIAMHQRQIAVLSPTLRGSSAIRRLGLGVIP